jgi:predicted dehydrogenase
MADGRSGKTDCAAYTDFREMIARPDLDACLIATGCHWHALASIYAARAGKDMYCEKPSTLTVGEGRAMAETMKRLGTVYQAGHQRRSVDSFRFMAEVVRKEMIGKLKSIYMEVWETGPAGPEAPQPVPPGFDYDMWLGWTPWHPYTNARVRGWTNFWDTGGGNMLDMGCHWNDTAQFVHQSDDTVPVEYEGEGVFAPGAFSEVPIRGEWRATYADGVRLVMHQVGPFEARYIKFIGTDGWIQLVDGTNTVTAEPASILKMRGISAKGWGDAGDHVRNFLDCVKSRNQMTTCHPESAHRATSIGHLGNIAIRLGRKIKFDPKTERIIGDPEADRMLNRPLRPPWHL